MATTTNYGWTTPDDTALVKDGASAIRTLGSSVDTTTKALNPSTTLGDIEYRSSTANTNTRLALGTAGQILKVNSGATAPEWGTFSPTFTNYTPTLKQGASDVSKTVNFAVYCEIGDLVWCAGRLDITGAGTAGGYIYIGLPVNIKADYENTAIGVAQYLDTSANAFYRAIAWDADSNEFAMYYTGDTNTNWGNNTGTQTTVAVASGDRVYWNITYRKA